MLKNEGAKSDLVFIQTKESGKLRKGQHYGNLQKKKKTLRMFRVHTFFGSNGGLINSAIFSNKLTKTFLTSYLPTVILIN